MRANAAVIEAYLGMDGAQAADVAG